MEERSYDGLDSIEGTSPPRNEVVLEGDNRPPLAEPRMKLNAAVKDHRIGAETEVLEIPTLPEFEAF